MNDDLAERLNRLESHVAHLERLHDQLNTVLVEQGRELARMQIRLRTVAETLEHAEADRVLAHPQRPPHAARP